MSAKKAQPAIDLEVYVWTFIIQRYLRVRQTLAGAQPRADRAQPGPRFNSRAEA